MAETLTSTQCSDEWQPPHEAGSRPDMCSTCGIYGSSGKVLPSTTQRFTVALATDGDVTSAEIAECLVALGYHGVYVGAKTEDHEHPCPSAGCLERLRSEGHLILGAVDCCICWADGRAAAGDARVARRAEDDDEPCGTCQGRGCPECDPADRQTRLAEEA
jgi:hypothetical protein